MTTLFISEWDGRYDWLQTTAAARHYLKHVSWRSRWIIFLYTLEQRMAVSCKIERADWCLFGLSSWLSTRSFTATRQTRSTAAWLRDNSTRLVASVQQTVDASKFPYLVGQFTQEPLCTILLWQIGIFNQNHIFCEIFMILFNFCWYLGLENFPR